MEQNAWYPKTGPGAVFLDLIAACMIQCTWHTNTQGKLSMRSILRCSDSRASVKTLPLSSSKWAMTSAAGGGR